jgi:hypothetical protein
MENIPPIALRRNNLTQPLSHRLRKRWERSLHSNFHSFKRTKCHVCQELCTCTRSQIHKRFVHTREHLFAIEVLEHFVESVFSTTLETVSYECGGPAEEDPAHAFSFVDQFPGLGIGFIEVGVDLSTGFDNIEGCDCSVGWAAGLGYFISWKFAIRRRQEGDEPMIPPSAHAAKYFPL